MLHTLPVFSWHPIVGTWKVASALPMAVFTDFTAKSAVQVISVTVIGSWLHC